MGFLKRLGSLLGGGKANRPPGHLFWIKCGQCGEVIKVRVDPSFDLEQEFDGGTDSVTGYVLHKEVLGNNCPRLMRLEVQYDGARREVARAVEGGELVSPPTP